MIKNTLFTSLVILLFFNNQLSYSQIENRAEYKLYLAIKKNDSKIFKDILKIDSMSETLKQNLQEASEVYKVKGLNFHKIKFGDIITLGGVVQSSHSTLVFLSENEDIYTTNLFWVVKNNDTVYKMDNDWRKQILLNQTEDCKEYYKSYIPEGIKYLHMDFLPSKDRRTFINTKVNFKNDSDIDVTYLKCRLELKRKSKEGNIESTPFFSQTIEYNGKIFSKNNFSLAFQNLNGFRTNFRIEKGSFKSTVTFLEVKPKLVEDCKESEIKYYIED